MVYHYLFIFRINVCIYGYQISYDNFDKFFSDNIFSCCAEYDDEDDDDDYDQESNRKRRRKRRRQFVKSKSYHRKRINHRKHHHMKDESLSSLDEPSSNTMKMRNNKSKRKQTTTTTKKHSHQDVDYNHNGNRNKDKQTSSLDHKKDDYAMDNFKITIDNDKQTFFDKQQQQQPIQRSTNDKFITKITNDDDVHKPLNHYVDSPGKKEEFCEYAYIVYNPRLNSIAMSRTLNELIPPDTTIIYKVDETSNNEDKLRIKSRNSQITSNECKVSELSNANYYCIKKFIHQKL